MSKIKEVSEKNPLPNQSEFHSLWFARAIVIGYFLFSIFLTYKHILTIAVIHDTGGEVRWTVHLAITLVWVFMIYLGYWFRSKSLKRM